MSYFTMSASGRNHVVENGPGPIFFSIFLPKFLLLNMIKDFAFTAINGIFNGHL